MELLKKYKIIILSVFIMILIPLLVLLINKESLSYRVTCGKYPDEVQYFFNKKTKEGFQVSEKEYKKFEDCSIEEIVK